MIALVSSRFSTVSDVVFWQGNVLMAVFGHFWRNFRVIFLWLMSSLVASFSHFGRRFQDFEVCVDFSNQCLETFAMVVFFVDVVVIEFDRSFWIVDEFWVIFCCEVSSSSFHEFFDLFLTNFVTSMTNVFGRLWVCFGRHFGSQFRSIAGWFATQWPSSFQKKWKQFRRLEND